MISDEEVRQLFLNGQEIQSKHTNYNREIYSQFFRGKVDREWENHHPGGCKRDMTVFRRFNVIPEYCFECYKVSIEPNTVLELFKLMKVFQDIVLENNNTRKCMVETRPEVIGKYKGFIYCRGIEEGKQILKMIRTIVSDKISKQITVKLKRGCSEYSISYPEYAKIEPNETPLKYKMEWRAYEDIVDNDYVVNSDQLKISTNNHSTYTLQDADTMLYWLKYAAAIKDMSYLKISGEVIRPLPVRTPQSSHLPINNKQATSTLKAGRNDPCICGSGKKYKHCCYN